MMLVALDHVEQRVSVASGLLMTYDMKHAAVTTVIRGRSASAKIMQKHVRKIRVFGVFEKAYFRCLASRDQECFPVFVTSKAAIKYVNARDSGNADSIACVAKCVFLPLSHPPHSVHSGTSSVRWMMKSMAVWVVHI